MEAMRDVFILSGTHFIPDEGKFILRPGGFV